MISPPPHYNWTFLHTKIQQQQQYARANGRKRKRTQTHEIQTTDTLDKTHKEVFARDADE